MKKLNLNNIELVMSAADMRQFPASPLPQIAFSGRSNVGKSSLLNTLTGRNKLARVSSSPGKTITINFFELDRRVFFVDLPGYGYAKRSEAERARWSRLVDSYLTSGGERIKLMLQLIDLKTGISADDAVMLDWLVRVRLPFAVVATKADKLNRGDRERSLTALHDSELIPAGIPIIPHSALTKEGCDAIWHQIYTVLENTK